MVPADLSANLIAPGAAEHPVTFSLLLLAAGLVPFALLCSTSFVKLSVVFTILRNAVGAGQFPSAAVSSTLALVLTLHIMMPVGEAVWKEGTAAWEVSAVKNAKGRTSARAGTAGLSVERLQAVFNAGSAPVKQFLTKHSRVEERAFFAELAKRQRQGNSAKVEAEDVKCRDDEKGRVCEIAGEDLFTLAPSFLISELKQAFAIGFTIFLPFLVIDLIVANVLAGLGMMMVSPTTIALPFKLLLFVLADGWFLLCRSLVLGYVNG